MSKRKRRGKRLFPKRYTSDYINTTQRPQVLMFKKGEDNSQGGDRWFDNHGRVRTAVGPKHQREPIKNNTFMQKVPATKGRLHHSIEEQDEKGTYLVEAAQTPLEAMAVRRVWASKLRAGHGIAEFNFMFYSEGQVRLLELGFTGPKWLWRQTNKGLGQVRVSEIYGSRERAVLALQEDRIFWDDWVDIPKRSTSQSG